MVEKEDESVRKWIEKAESDFGAAENSLKSGDYGWAGFQAQQSVEKAFKALLIKRIGKFPKIHDLKKLAELVNAPDNIIELCLKINPVYIVLRYPDIGGEYSKKDVEEIIKFVEEVLKWIKGRLS